MPEDLDDVARWRSLAAEALSLAAQMSDPASKQTMLDIAQANDAIAREFNTTVQSLVTSGKDFESEVAKFRFQE